MHAGLLRLPRLIRAAPDTGTDAELLRRFAATRDEPAFAELVRRHGPLVLAVCRRVVSDAHLADDAFQATFVVLARKAASAGVGCRLSTWLHSVAVKVSLRARTMIGRRAKRETLTATVPERGATAPPADDTAAVLDEEIDRLPEALRAAVVLCELRGVSRRDAARELGIAEGTLSSRLASARKKLAERLRARGLAPAALIPAIFLPTDLATAAVAVSTGRMELSSQLAQLVDGGMKMALLTKLKLAAVAVAVAVLTAGGFGVGGRWGNESAAAPVPKDIADPGVIWVFRPADGELVGSAPDGKKVRAVKLVDGMYPKLFLGITRDGQHALVAAEKGKVPAGDKAGYDALHAGKLTVHLLPLFAADSPTDTGIGCQYWSRYVLGRDGKTLVVEHDRSDPERVPAGPIRYETVAYDLTTFRGTKRPALAKGFWLSEELANGDRILAFGQHGTDKRPLQSFHLLPAGSDKPVSLTGENETDYCQLSPDGKRLLVTGQFSHKTKPGDSFHRMFILDRASGKAEPFVHRENTMHAHGHWSPDGTRVVYEWLEEGPPVPVKNFGALRPTPVARGQVAVADTNGKTEKVVLEYDGCAGGSHDAAQLWHEARPRLVGWYPSRRTAPVPKAAPLQWKEEAPIDLPNFPVQNFAVSPDGKMLAAVTGNTISLHDPATGAKLNKNNFLQLKASATRLAVAFSPEGKLAFTGANGVVVADSERLLTEVASVFESWKIWEGIPGFDPHHVAWLHEEKTGGGWRAGEGRLVATNGVSFKEVGWTRSKRENELDRVTGEAWESAEKERHRPTVLVTAPAAHRVFHSVGESKPKQFDLAVRVTKSQPHTVHTLTGHAARPTSGAMSADGKLLLSGDDAGELIVWDGEKFAERKRWKLDGEIVSVALAADNRTAAALRLTETTTDAGVRTEWVLYSFDVTDLREPPAVVWRTTLPGSYTNSAYRLSGQTGREDAGPYRASIQFHPDGTKLFGSLGEPYLKTRRDDPKWQKPPGLRVWSLGRKNAPVPKAVGWKEAAPITFDEGRVTGVAYSPSGKTLAVARDNGKLDFYDPVTRKHITTMDVGGEKGAKIATVTAVAFAPTSHPKNGDVFAVTHKHGVKFGTVSLGIFTDDAAKVDGIPVNWTIPDFDPHQLKWLGDKSLVATNGAKLGWRFRLDGKPDKLDFDWELPKGKRHGLTVLEAIPGFDDYFLTNGSLFEEKNEVEIAVAPPASSPQARLPGHKSRPTTAVLSKDAKRIVSVDAGGTLIVWEGERLMYKEKSRVELGEGVVQLALAPDGKTVAVVRAFTDTDLYGTSGRTLINLELSVFDVTDPPKERQPLWTARGLLSEAKTLTAPVSLAFAPDGKALLAAFADPYVADKDAKSLGVKVWTLPEPAAPPKKNAPVPKPAKDAGLIWTYNPKSGALTAFTPAGAKETALTLPDGRNFIDLIERGRRIAFRGTNGRLHLRGVSEPAADATDTGLTVAPDDELVFHPDGSQVVRVSRVEGDNKRITPPDFEHLLFDLTTGKETAIQLPKNHQLRDWSPDGKTWRLFHHNTGANPNKLPTFRWVSVPAGGGKPTQICGEAMRWLDPSPDGKTFLASGFQVGKATPGVFCTYLVDAANGALTQLVAYEKVQHVVARWSPTGSQMAVIRYRQDPKPDAPRATSLTVAGATGRDEKELFDWPDDGHETRLLGWYPAKADPPARRNAPVPKAVEDTKGLTASVTFEKKEILLGEPVYFTFAVQNPTGDAWQFEQGGDYRNRLGRPNSFTVTVTGSDGKAVPQPDSGFDMGGMSHMVKLPADGKAAFHPLFLPHWATFDKPGEYTITVKRKVGLVPADVVGDVFRAKATPVNLSATAKFTVLPADAKKLGELIETLGRAMLDPKASTTDAATRKLQEIRDQRVIPHFIELGKSPSPSARSEACRALIRFKTDEVFAALKAIHATTLADLHDGATARDLDGVRHSAVGALADCGHPDALPLVWNAGEDGYMGVRLTVLHKAYEVKSPEARKVIARLLDDADERIRNEAKRYTDLLAKEK